MPTTTTVTVSDADVSSAATYLQNFLSEKIPDADFNEGSVVNDFTVKAIAYIFAFLRQEVTKIQQSGSIKRVVELRGTADYDSAVDALLSNLFLTRKKGQASRMVVTLHFSALTDVIIAPGHRFSRTSTNVFVTGRTDNLVVPSEDLVPNYSSSGSFVDYTIDVLLVATKTGDAGNLDPGRFVRVDTFNPYFTYAENKAKGFDGKAIEDSDTILARAADSLTVRNLINDKSIRTVLLDTFAALDAVLVVGHGDPEMRRDLGDDRVSGLLLHVGGHDDVYCGLPRSDKSETLIVGDEYQRPDGLITSLIDATGFVGVSPGQVLNVIAGMPDAPRTFIISEVLGDRILVNPRHPFTVATQDTGSLVSYSIGTIGPDFNNVIAPRTTGVTSRAIVQTDAVVLEGGPHYRIRRIELLTLSGTVDTVLGPRVNTAPVGLEYNVVCVNPQEAQSEKDFSFINFVGINGRTVRVVYETLVDLAPIDAYVNDRYVRVLCANTLARGFHPIYIGVNITYTVKRTATTLVSSAAVRTAVFNFITAYDFMNELNVSDIITEIKTKFPDINSVKPFNITFTLIAPDGQLYAFTTADSISIDLGSQKTSSMVTNGPLLRVPVAGGDNGDPALRAVANQQLLQQFHALGISDRTVRYYCDLVDIVVAQAT